MEEVAPMRIHTMMQPLASLTHACAPSALELVPAAAVPMLAGERVLVSGWAEVRPAALAVERAQVARAFQVPVQAELAQKLALTNGISGTTSTTGFKGTNASAKRYADGGSGVPPRGRPV
jgi:hypothetical protein